MVQLSSDWTLNEDLRLNRVASLDHDRPSAYGIANQVCLSVLAPCEFAHRNWPLAPASLQFPKFDPAKH